MLGKAPLRGIRDRVLTLRSMSTLSGLDDEGFVLIAEHARNRSFAKGDWLCREGNPIESVYIILDGRVRVSRLGRELVVISRPGGVGWLSTLARDENGIDAVALDDVQALEVPGGVLSDALAENFSLTHRILAKISSSDSLLLTNSCRSNLQPAVPHAFNKRLPSTWRQLKVLR